MNPRHRADIIRETLRESRHSYRLALIPEGSIILTLGEAARVGAGIKRALDVADFPALEWKCEHGETSPHQGCEEWGHIRAAHGSLDLLCCHKSIGHLIDKYTDWDRFDREQDDSDRDAWDAAETAWEIHGAKG